MAFTYNPHRHVKIWLSKDKDSFLNFENQLRFIRLREKNPGDEINFVYDSKLLNEKSLANLSKFCSKFNISSHDVRILSKNCHARDEKNLIDIYEQEIEELNSGRNLAAASDMLRWISPVYSLGTYTDFDINIDTSSLLKYIEVESDMLVNLGTIESEPGRLIRITNNDFIAVVDSHSATAKLSAIQSNIYLEYTKKESRPYEKIVNQYIKCQQFNQNIYYDEMRNRWRLFSWIINYAEDESYSLMLETNPAILAFSQLWKYDWNATNLELRQKFQERITDEFIKERVFKGSEEDYRKRIKKHITWFNWFFLPSSTYQELKKLAAMGNEELLIYTKTTISDTFMKQIIIYTTGPGVVGPSLYSMHQCLAEYKKMSIYQYGFERCFKLTNSCTLGTTRGEFLQFVFNSQNEKVADNSWLKAGEQKIQKYEQKMDSSSKIITRLIKKKCSLKKQSDTTLPVQSNPSESQAILTPPVVEPPPNEITKLLP